MLRKRLQLGLIHVAVALTALPIESTLNRILINDLAISATLVALLVSLPYLLSPMQIFIGNFTDRYPILQRRRVPYIGLGLVISVLGLSLTPIAVALIATQVLPGLLLAMLAFGLWGFGFNLATVAYFALASEIFGEEGSSKAISTMYAMMIISVIVMAIVLGQMLEPYSALALRQAIWFICGVALALGGLGLLNLEAPQARAGKRRPAISVRQTLAILTESRQTRLFFSYLILLLTAVLGQDVLLEPYAAEAFGMSVQETTRLTAIYGVAFLTTLVLGGWLDKRSSKQGIARLGSWTAVGAFALIISGGVIAQVSLFYLGVVSLGLAIGFATVSNHALMLDMTTPQNVGLFIGAWGLATSMARLSGSVLSGAVRDALTLLLNDPILGYSLVFSLNIILLMVSLSLLRRVDIPRFQKSVQVSASTPVEPQVQK